MDVCAGLFHPDCGGKRGDGIVVWLSSARWIQLCEYSREGGGRDTTLMLHPSFYSLSVLQSCRTGSRISKLCGKNFSAANPSSPARTRPWHRYEPGSQRPNGSSTAPNGPSANSFEWSPSIPHATSRFPSLWDCPRSCTSCFP